jgi:CRISPR-associated protein Cmr1
MRKISEEVAAQLSKAHWQDECAAQKPWRTTSHAVVLETPLYGGGVRAGEVDEKQPIRVSGLRGQFRFWWRVACGPFPSSTEMFRREAAIWGGIGRKEAQASFVRVTILDMKAPKILPAFEYKQANGGCG